LGLKASFADPQANMAKLIEDRKESAAELVNLTEQVEYLHQSRKRVGQNVKNVKNVLKLETKLIDF
jgi:hypothetical protein